VLEYLIILLIATYSYAFSRRIYDATNDTIPWNRTFQGPDTDMDYEYTSNITIMGHMYRFRNYLFIEDLSFEPAYCYQNHSIPDLMSLAECLPEKFFVWGFSSLMVYINLGLLMIWIFGMYIVWLDANIYSALCRSGRKVRGDFRAVTDLSEAMKEVLGTETCAYSDRELARELSTQPGIQYYASDLPDDEVSHIGLSSLRLGRVQYNSTKLYGKYEKNR